MVARKRIHHLCVCGGGGGGGGVKNSITQSDHSGSPFIILMPSSNDRGGYFYPTIILMIDSYVRFWSSSQYDSIYIETLKENY